MNLFRRKPKCYHCKKRGLPAAVKITHQGKPHQLCMICCALYIQHADAAGMQRVEAPAQQQEQQ